MKIERDAGIVLCRFEAGNSGVPTFLLLQGSRGLTWDFPKGHVKPGEEDLACALRELKEETGITDVELVSGFCEPMSFEFPGSDLKIISKSVVLFLGVTRAVSVTLDADHCQWEFLREADAAKLLKLKSRQVLAKANKRLLEKNRLGDP